MHKVKPLSECKLYAFVDTAYLRGRLPEVVAQQLCDGGADLIQLRAKQSSPAEIRKMAEKILPVTARAGVGLIINDHLSIADELAAQVSQPLVASKSDGSGSTLIGCHLGQEDFFDAGFSHVSQLSTLTAQLKLGLSTHSPEQATRAVEAGADYVAIGPVYATGTKPSAKPVTLEYVRWAAADIKIPWFAIGGINLNTVNDVLDAGARRICVVSAILNAEDIIATCGEFKKRLG
jgi:thiamine-phosphate pyrophosphorylase